MTDPSQDPAALIANQPVIVFDGLCVLCSANAQFMLKHDRKGHFKLAAMQGPVGASLMQHAGLDPDDPESFVVFDKGRVLMNSDAVIHIWSRLGWPWKAVTIGRLIPRSLRDVAYRFVARNRYRIFGKRETCWMPDNAQARRIL